MKVKDNRTLTVKEMKKVHLTGNIIDNGWYDVLTYDNGKFNHNAADILAEVVYWYRPLIIHDEETGKLIARKKRFKSDKLQRSYQSLSDKFGMTKRQAMDAVKFLKKYHLVETELRHVKLDNGGTISNVLFIEPVPLNIKNLCESIPIRIENTEKKDTFIINPPYIETYGAYTLKRRTYTKTTNNKTISKDIEVDEKSSNSKPGKKQKHTEPLIPPEDNPFKTYSYIVAKEKYLGIIDRTFIKIAGINSNIRKDSKTMFAALKYIQQVQQGVFVKFNNIKTTGLLAEADWSILDRKYSDEELEVLFKKVSTRLKKIMNPQSDFKHPEYNPYMHSVFLNERTHMSYFVYLACCPLQRVNKAREKSVLTNVKISLTKTEPEFKKLSAKLYNVEVVNKLEPEDQVKYYMNMRAMMEWRVKNKKKLAELNDGWRTLFGTNSLMFQTISRFLDGFPVKYIPNFLVIDGYNWNDFIYFCMNGWDVDILGKRKRRT